MSHFILHSRFQAAACCPWTRLEYFNKCTDCAHAHAQTLFFYRQMFTFSCTHSTIYTHTHTHLCTHMYLTDTPTRNNMPDHLRFCTPHHTRFKRRFPIVRWLSMYSRRTALRRVKPSMITPTSSSLCGTSKQPHST